MAIPFANTKYVGRSSGGNACSKAAYNARMKIKDLQTNITYNFQNRGGHAFHQILLPPHVDQKFSDPQILMNEIESTEKRKNSLLLKEYLLALPDEANISLGLKKAMIYEFISASRFIEDGLALQIDIHLPDENDRNWHAHLLVTSRRFTADGKGLGKKARDLELPIRAGRQSPYILSKLITPPTEIWIAAQNRIFSNYGLENRVDLISQVPEKHIGPVRMRSSLNQAAIFNQERKSANRQLLTSGEAVLDWVTKYSSVFRDQDLERAVKCLPEQARAQSLVLQAKQSPRVISLFNLDGSAAQLYTTKEVRAEELKLLRLGRYLAQQKNLITECRLKDLNQAGSILPRQETEALAYLLLGSSGVRILKAPAGAAKSQLFAQLTSAIMQSKIELIALTSNYREQLELAALSNCRCEVTRGFLFKQSRGCSTIALRSLIILDEAHLVSNDQYQALLKTALIYQCNLLMIGDEHQGSSLLRGGMFELYAGKLGYCQLAGLTKIQAGPSSLATSLSRPELISSSGAENHDERCSDSINPARPLAAQPSFSLERRASLHYLSPAEKLASYNQPHYLLAVVSKGLSSVCYQAADLIAQRRISQDCHNFKKLEITQQQVEEILALNHHQSGDQQATNQPAITQLVRVVAGNNFIDLGSAPGGAPRPVNQLISDATAAQADRLKPDLLSNLFNLHRPPTSQFRSLKLRQEISWQAEKIAIDLLGEPNYQLSSSTILRFGRHGRLAICISGAKSGNWHDFDQAHSGSLVELVQQQQGGSLKQAAASLGKMLEINDSNNLALIHSDETESRYAAHYQQIGRQKFKTPRQGRCTALVASDCAQLKMINQPLASSLSCTATPVIIIAAASCDHQLSLAAIFQRGILNLSDFQRQLLTKMSKQVPSAGQVCSILAHLAEAANLPRLFSELKYLEDLSTKTDFQNILPGLLDETINQEGAANIEQFSLSQPVKRLNNLTAEQLGKILISTSENILAIIASPALLNDYKNHPKVSVIASEPSQLFDHYGSNSHLADDQLRMNLTLSGLIKYSCRYAAKSSNLNLDLAWLQLMPGRPARQTGDKAIEDDRQLSI